MIEPVLRGYPPVDGTMPARTRRYWVARYRQAEQEHDYGYIGLLPRLWLSGNREDRLSEKTRTTLNQFIEDSYETLKQKSMREVYGELVLSCDAEGIIAPSYKTFAREVRERPTYAQMNYPAASGRGINLLKQLKLFDM